MSIIIGSILSSLGGASLHFIQDWLKGKQEAAQKDQDLEIWKTQQQVLSDLKIKETQAGVKIEEEHTAQKQLDTQIANSNSNASVDTTFITQANQNISSDANYLLCRISNFWTAIVRPNITYVFAIAIVATNHILLKMTAEQLVNLPSWVQDYLHSQLYFMDGIMTYWFLRRDTEKRESMDYFLKRYNSDVGSNNLKIKKKV